MNALFLRELRDADEFYEFKTWPLWAKQAFLNNHKNRNARMYLWVFFWKNGLPPGRATYWTMRHRTYDRDAWRSIQDLAAKATTKEGQAYLQRIRVFDMEKGRPD